jgi:hypothetical protein
MWICEWFDFETWKVCDILREVWGVEKRESERENSRKREGIRRDQKAREVRK